MFCPRAGLSLQTQHSPLYSLLRLPPSYSSFIIMLSIIWYILLPRTFFSFTIPSRACFSKQFLLSQWPSQFLFLFFISYRIVLPFPTLSSTTEFFIFSVHFTRPILLHIHISNASSRFCSFRRTVQVSAPYNATLHTMHFTSPLLSSFSKVSRKCFS